MTYKDMYEKWRNNPKLDTLLKEELLTLSDEDIKERFQTPLKFGTGGLRGPMGVGISRLNVHTIMQAAAGFGQYLLKHFKSGKIVISYDNRRDSKRFAQKSARVLGAYGFEVKLFERLRPTPMLSYAVRYFNAIGGIMITASHNPKEDNGFKAYNHTGAQVNLVEAKEIINEVSQIEDVFQIKECSEDLIQTIDSSFDDIYLNDITSIQILNQPKKLKVIYSPLHGTGGQVIPKALKNLGYDVITVLEEMTPDPNFTHTASSNPEEQKAYTNALKKAKAHDADIVLITDPDADRLGVAVKHDNDYQLLTGNQTAALELDYILNNHPNLPKDGIVYTTVVTSDLIKRIAEEKSIQVIETLTGFKFIGEQAELNDAPYIFGCEESYGSLISDKVRDKDAVQACIMLSEMANAYLKDKKTLVDQLHHLYLTYGYHLEYTESIFFNGLEGPKKMASILNDFRENPLQVDNYTLVEWRDYLSQKRYKDGQVSALTLPSSNVIEYRFDSFWIILRPSGTEPKLKIYFGIQSKDDKLAQDMLTLLKQTMVERMSYE